VLHVAIHEGRIVLIDSQDPGIKAVQVIDASGLAVSPGFIDPHTHSIYDLKSEDRARRRNLNYQFQGVTTVVNGNDGFGEPDIRAEAENLMKLGIGTNTAFFIGHGALRKSVMGGENRAPTELEMTAMTDEIESAMDDGALGLSTGLYYAPGSFSKTDEIITLAKAASRKGGLYDSHMRNESDPEMAPVDEVIRIAREAQIPANIAHIKALGADVHGQSQAIIDKIEAARAAGLDIGADQYPWRASGTRISNALIPRWVKAGTDTDYMKRLNDPGLEERIRAETTENLRKRGGAGAILITQKDTDWTGLTLEDAAAQYNKDPVDMAIFIARNGDARIASFNMAPEDVENFMMQDWVMTSSDGSKGHPRLYGSFPRKYAVYVKEKGLMSVASFIHRSTGMVADRLNLCERGYIKLDHFADIVIFDPDTFSAKADFQNPEILSEGVQYLFVNGTPVIKDGKALDILPGRVLKRCEGE